MSIMQFLNIYGESMREGQAKVLSERELSRVVNVAKKKAHAKRNVALLYCSFGLGLRAKEMAAMRISANSLQQLFHRMYSDAKLQGASSHSGRRTFATTLIEKGVDIKAVSTLMGHSSIAMTARYVENNPARLKQIVTDVL